MTTASEREAWARAARYNAIPNLHRRIAIRAHAPDPETEAAEPELSAVEDLPARRRSRRHAA